MSLDVYLTVPVYEDMIERVIRILDKRQPEEEIVFCADITHNLRGMAECAGIYKHLWRPEEIGIEKAKELIEPLRAGLAWMKADPEKFKQYNAPNGWGVYEHFVPWIQKYLDACECYPDARVHVSR